jgi:molybdopterin converting factor small subunit
MAHVRLPGILAREAGGQAEFETAGTTLRAALSELPIADLIFDEHGVLRPLVNVFVDGDDARDALDTSLEPQATVRIVAAVAGG